MDLQVSPSPRYQHLAWFAAWRQQDRSSLSGKLPPCFLHCPSGKYDAHIGCSYFDTKSKEMLTQLRAEMSRSLKRLICHSCKMTVSKKLRRRHRRETQARNPQLYFDGSRWWGWAAILHTWAIFSSLLTLTSLPTVQFVFIVNYKERSTATCRNRAAP